MFLVPKPCQCAERCGAVWEPCGGVPVRRQYIQRWRVKLEVLFVYYVPTALVLSSADMGGGAEGERVDGGRRIRRERRHDGTYHCTLQGDKLQRHGRGTTRHTARPRGSDSADSAADNDARRLLVTQPSRSRTILLDCMQHCVAVPLRALVGGRSQQRVACKGELSFPRHARCEPRAPVAAARDGAVPMVPRGVVADVVRDEARSEGSLAGPQPELAHGPKPVRPRVVMFRVLREDGRREAQLAARVARAFDDPAAVVPAGACRKASGVAPTCGVTPGRRSAAWRGRRAGSECTRTTAGSSWTSLSRGRRCTLARLRGRAQRTRPARRLRSRQRLRRCAPQGSHVGAACAATYAIGDGRVGEEHGIQPQRGAHTDSALSAKGRAPTPPS